MGVKPLPALAIAGLTLLAASPSHGQAIVVATAHWQACDGYGKATAGGDGMTEYATVAGLFSPPGHGTTVQGEPTAGVHAISSCDKALAELPPRHWRRKINLLQARALHRLESATPESALADLDLANSAAAGSAASDRLYGRSQQLGLSIVKAMALQRLGKDTEAAELTSRAVEMRPYDRGVLLASLKIAESSDDAEGRAQLLARYLRVDPIARTKIFIGAIDNGEFEKALAVHPYLAAPHVRGPSTYGLLNEAARCAAQDFETARFKAETGGYQAYALAALGREREARNALSQAAEAVKRAADTPARPCEPLDKRDLATFTALVAEIKGRYPEVARSLLRMSDKIELRLKILQGSDPEIVAAVQSMGPPSDGPDFDLKLAIADLLPAAERDAARADVVRRRAFRAAQHAELDVKSRDFFKLLPAPELDARTPVWREAKRPALAMKTSQADTTAVGYRESVAPDGTVTIRFRGARSPGAQVEEIALLRAADLTRQSGKRAFILLDRRDTEWLLNAQAYGTTIRSDPGGFETELHIRFVDAPTADVETWPGLIADEVYAALAPTYIRP